MNPSASGWIAKYGSLVKEHLDTYADFEGLYNGLKKTGFVYGINIKTPRFIEAEHPFSEDEIAKVNLLTALYFTFSIETKKTNFKEFQELTLQFYKDLQIYETSFFNSIFAERKTSLKLEKLINSRVYLEDNLFSKTFNSIITNSLLFIDVLLLKRYLQSREGIHEYAQRLEYLSINVAYHALSSKEKNKKDEKLAQLLESSLTYIDGDTSRFDGSYRERLLRNEAIWENSYFMDVACLTIWEDQSLEYQESQFIFGIGKDLGLDKKQISRALEEISSFFKKNADMIPFLEDKNLALQFYDSMAKVVNKLILRNRKRLQKELSESKELVYLISKSASKDLTAEERKKVQNQLIDIFKTIPSLAIFLLPGGAVLLPIFIKLVPKLLPSSFDENRVKKE